MQLNGAAALAPIGVKKCTLNAQAQAEGSKLQTGDEDLWVAVAETGLLDLQKDDMQQNSPGVGWVYVSAVALEQAEKWLKLEKCHPKAGAQYAETQSRFLVLHQVWRKSFWRGTWASAHPEL